MNVFSKLQRLVFRYLLPALFLCPFSSFALQGTTGIHDPSRIIKHNGVYHVWGTGNQIYHLTSTDLINWTTAATVFDSATFPSWITTYVPDFEGFFWAPDCVYMNGTFYMYYSCSTWGSKVSAIGLATSTDLVSWTDQGYIISSGDLSDFNAIDAAPLLTSSGELWLAYGSFNSGIKILQCNTSTGKPKNSTRYSIASPGGSDWQDGEAGCVIQNGSYYYLFYNRGGCCSGTSSTYYVLMGRATSPSGPYYDKSGVAMTTANSGTTVLAASGRYIGPGHLGLYQENGLNFISYHYYDGDNNGTPTLGIANMGWDNGWPFITQDWIAAGRYQIVNKNSGKVWNALGCTGEVFSSITQASSNGLTCQKWDFSALGNGIFRIDAVLGGLTADIVNCSGDNSAKLNLYNYLATPCQQYRLERTGDGSLVFASVNGNRVVEVPNASLDDSMQLALWNYNGHNCQKWDVTDPDIVSVKKQAGSVYKGEITIHPDPLRNGSFIVSGMTNEKQLVKIVNLQGKIAFSGFLKNGTCNVNLVPGIYSIMIGSIYKTVVVNGRNN